MENENVHVQTDMILNDNKKNMKQKMLQKRTWDGFWGDGSHSLSVPFTKKKIQSYSKNNYKNNKYKSKKWQ